MRWLVSCQLDTGWSHERGGSLQLRKHLHNQAVTGMEGILLITDGWGRARSTVGGDTPGLVILGSVEKEV